MTFKYIIAFNKKLNKQKKLNKFLYQNTLLFVSNLITNLILQKYTLKSVFFFWKI